MKITIETYTQTDPHNMPPFYAIKNPYKVTFEKEEKSRSYWIDDKKLNRLSSVLNKLTTNVSHYFDSYGQAITVFTLSLDTLQQAR